MSSKGGSASEVDANEFAGRLLDSLVRQAPARNVICSPFSAWLPLAALANVTQSSTRSALFRAIGCREDSMVEHINATAASLLTSLGSGGYLPVKHTLDDGIQIIQLEPSGQRSLRLANSLWVHRDSTPDPDFVQVFADHYDGAARTLDFADPEAATMINRWVADHTDGIITDLIDHIDPLWAVVIANAIYFRGLWSCQFDRDHTQPGTFHAPDGDRTAQFMRFGSAIPGWWDHPYKRERVASTEWMDYYEDEQMQMVVLPFTTLTENLAILLPTHDTPESLLTDPRRLESAWKQTVPTRGELSLPRFRLEANLDLSETLASLGVPLFDKSSSPLADLIPDKQPVWLSQVKQRVILDVDEQGTTAAAATYGEMGVGAGMVDRNEEPFTMICDQPFAVALVGSADYEKPVILFCGIVNKPEQ